MGPADRDRRVRFRMEREEHLDRRQKRATESSLVSLSSLAGLVVVVDEEVEEYQDE